MNEPKLIKRKSLMDRSVKEQRKVLVIATFFLVTLFFGSSYALLTNFVKSDTDVVNIKTANMNMSITSTNITLSGKLPETDESGLRNATAVPITLKNVTTGPFTSTDTVKFYNTSPSTLKIVKYEVKLVQTSTTSTSLSDQYVKYVVSTDGGVTYSSPKKLSETNNIMFTGYNLDLNQTKEIYVKAWIDENAGDNGINKTFNGSVRVELYQKADVPGVEIVKANLKSNSNDSSCQNVPLTWTDPDDGITYISGSATCIDFNYVWYSGKMWRITAIYPDGRMKLVTEDAITSIFWGSDIEYDGSYIYQWLNEDFKDTLINPDTVLENATWNYSTDGNSTPKRPETIETQKTKEARIGLTNAYEYYNSYRCIGSSACTGSTFGTSYLNIGYYWWLMTPYSDSSVRRVGDYGGVSNPSPSGSLLGVRPSIILHSNVLLSGNGIKNDPYKIVGNDYESASVGTKLYERYSGEYVYFNNEKYRIVSTENNITKLTRNDVLRDENTDTTPKTAITKYFASSVYFGKSGNTETNTYWDYYLNNNWYNSIDTTYKNMMVDGTYYLGLYDSGAHYKSTICKDSNLNLVTTKNCTRYPSNLNIDGYDINKIYVGKVGLPRVGEMFSAQLGGGYSVSSAMWLLTPYSDSSVIYMGSNGTLASISVNSMRAARPSITLSSEVKIACNSSKCDGTEDYPYDLTV